MDSITAYIRRDCLLTESQLKRLKDHKYSSSDVSILDELCMKKFWDWLVSFYPLWLAPNLITLVGFMCNFIAVLFLAFYSPDGKQEAPRFSYLLCGICLFLYQALDATDGKQARRTKSSSPLGELFDHGCDSVSQIMVTLEVALSLSMGDYPDAMLFVSLYSVALFYMAHWQTYVCGTLRFSRFDVTEAQFSIMGICAMSFIFGPGMWKASLFGIELRMLLLVATGFQSVFNSAAYFNVIFTGGVGKNGSTVADTSVLFPILPLLTVIVPPVIIYFKSETGVFQEHLVLYTFIFGFVASKITNRIVIAHMSKSEMNLWDSVLLGPALLIANQYFNNLFSEYPLLVFVLVLTLMNVLLHATLVTQQICAYLRINCFTIPYPPPKDQ